MDSYLLRELEIASAIVFAVSIFFLFKKVKVKKTTIAVTEMEILHGIIPFVIILTLYFCKLSERK